MSSTAYEAKKSIATDTLSAYDHDIILSPYIEFKVKL
jgi:hypothetical protein